MCGTGILCVASGSCGDIGSQQVLGNAAKFLLGPPCWDIFLRGTYLESGDQADSNGIYHKKCPHLAIPVLLVLTGSVPSFSIF